MKSFFVILVTFVLAFTCAFATGPGTPNPMTVNGDGLGAGSAPESEEYSTFIHCVPRLFMIDHDGNELPDQPIPTSDLGDFFLSPNTSYTIDPGHYLGWRLEGPTTKGNGDQIIYTVYTTNGTSTNTSDQGVNLDVQWTYEYFGTTGTSSGLLNEQYVPLVDPTPNAHGGCDGWAEFRIHAMVLTINPLYLGQPVPAGPRQFFITVRADVAQL
jgi:hypothetical protein